jgi:hypothetical protein
MIEVILDTLKDSLKLLPFLFIAFLIIELLEHKFAKQSKKVLERSGKFGPILGGLLGCFPQCGFSVLATNLYVTRIITLGTLISIYLSTSDEMLPMLLSRGSSFSEIIKLLSIKLLIGVVCGFIIDLVVKKKDKIMIKDLCNEEDCHCEQGIFISSIKHTIHTLVFIMLVSFILNIIMFYGGREVLSNMLGTNSLLAPFVASMIGLIPNCAASVVITELYLSGLLSLASTVAGLLTGSGVAILVLFKSNKDKKENIRIVLLLYLIGVASGLILELLSVLVLLF